VSLASLTVEGYRSVHSLWTPLERVNVVVGPNGSGKTNLYRSLALLVAAAQGGLARAIAREGGMASVMWAGTHRRQDRRGVIVEAQDEALSYRLELGLPIPLTPTLFPLDPEVKSEEIAFREGKRKTLLMERKGPTAWMRDDDGRRVTYPRELAASESVLSQLRDRHRYPEVSSLAERMQGWRLYHHFRTDADAPLRQPQVGVSTHVLASSGDDLAAALQTIREVGDGGALDEAVEDAFPGARLLVEGDGLTRVALRMRVPGIGRPLDAAELSDGTVRYLCLLAALLTPRPPELMALNEPETSLHPQLLAPLGRLVARAGRSSQLFVTTHARELADAVAAATGARTIELRLAGGATQVVGQRLADDDDDADSA
jgi:predicted ATPase